MWLDSRDSADETVLVVALSPSFDPVLRTGHGLFPITTDKEFRRDLGSIIKGDAGAFEI